MLRCDDGITYHLVRCVVRCGEEGWKRDEVIDALNVAMIVGGSIRFRTCVARLPVVRENQQPRALSETSEGAGL